MGYRKYITIAIQFFRNENEIAANMDMSNERGVVSGLAELIYRLAAHTENENEIRGGVIGYGVGFGLHIPIGKNEIEI